jgi:hypothetical protein
MLQPKKKTSNAFDKAFTQEASGQGAPQDFITQTAGGNYSVSAEQLEASNQGFAGDRASKLASFSRQNVLDNEKFKQIKKEREAYLAKPQNDLEELHKQVLKDDKKFVDFKTKLRNLDKQKERKTQIENKSTDLWDENGLNIFAPIWKLRDVFASEENKWGRSDTEEKELAALKPAITKTQTEINKEITPTIKLLNQKLWAEQTQDKIQRDKLAGTIYKDRKADEKRMQSMSFKDLMSKIYLPGSDTKQDSGELDELAILNSAMRKRQETIKYTDDFLKGKNNVWDGLKNKGSDLMTLGLYSFTEELAYKTPVINKFNRLINELGNEKAAFDSLTYAEQQLIKTNAVHDDLRQNKATAGMFEKDGVDWYRHADGTADSLVFMEQMFFTGGPTALIEKGLIESTLGKTLTKSVLKNTVRKSLQRKIGLYGLQKTAQLTGAVLSSPLSPGSGTNTLQEHNGGIEIIKDNDGENRYLVRDGIFKAYQRDYNYKNSLLEKEKAKLQAKENLSEEEKERLDQIESDQDQLNQEFNTLRPKSWFESAAYGTWETAKENFIELAGGEIAGKALGKVAGWAAKTEIGKFALKPTHLTTKAYKGVSNLYKEGAERYTNSVVGKITGKAAYRTGSNRIIQGLPEEMFEEVLSQLTPSINRDYSEQLKQLKDPSFYVDVLAQTAMMGGMFTTVGGVSSAINWRQNGKMYDAKRNIIKKYKAIDKAVTDEDLANTIVMSTAGTNYSIADYDAKIEELRDKKQFKAADELEQKKFVNMATIAMQTNTLDQFEMTLDNLLKRSQSSLGEGGMSPETLQNIQLAKEKIEKIKSTHEQYKGRTNVNTIVDLANKKLAIKQGLQNISSEISTQRALANEELETLRSNAPDHLKDADIDTILNDNPFTQEEMEDGTFAFVKSIDEANSPAIQAYIRLLETQEEMRYSHRETMKLFNEETSSTREAELLKNQEVKRAINKQIRDSIEFAEANNLSSLGLEIDSNGKARIGKDFIEHTFNRVISTQGVKEKDFEAIKQDYLNMVEIQEAQRAMQANNRINSLYDQAQIVIQEQKQKKADKKKAEEDAKLNPIEGTQLRLFEEDNVEMASQEEIEAYEENVDTAREILLSHPVILENDKYDNDYIEKVESSLPLIVDLATQGMGMTRGQLREQFPHLSDPEAEALAFALNHNMTLPGKKETEEDKPINSLETVAEGIQNAQSDIENIISPEGDFDPDEIVIDEEDTLSTFQLNPATNLTEDALKGLKQVIGKVHEDLKKQFGREPSFKEMVYHFIKFTNKVKAETFFDMYRAGWEANGFAATNYDDVYNEIFEPSRDSILAADSFIESIYGSQNSFTETEDSLRENSPVELRQVESNQTSINNFTENNVPIRTENENRITSPALRLGFNAIRYEEVEILDAQGIGTGTFIRQTVITDSLNDENTQIDYKDLLNPDMYNPGDSVNVGVAPEDSWSTIMINVGRDQQNKPILKSYADILKEKEEKDPNYRNTVEFVESVPMFAYDNKGTPLAYIHDSSWYNEWNVADPANATGVINPRGITLAHKQAIDDARVAASKFRQSVFSKQVSKIKIKEKTEGPYYSIANKVDPNTGKLLPLYTIEEANPDSHIVTQGKQNVLEKGNNMAFENEKRVIVNKNEIAQKKQGTTWHLRRIGVDEQGRETWRAFNVVRYPKEEELETIKWAWSAYSFFDHKETLQGSKKSKIIQEVRNDFLPPEYQLTPEQAKEIIKDIKALTGYNLMNFEEASSFFKLFMQPRSGDSNAQFGRTLYTGNLNTFAQHTSRDGLQKNCTVPMIVNGKVVSTNKTYSDYLKTTLKTDVKSFNVGTADKPVYATSIQPKIVFEYETGMPEQNAVTQTQQNKIEAEQIKEEIAKVESPDEVIQKANDLLSKLGFSTQQIQAMPVTMNGVEHLRNILNTTPGLSIAQESQLLNFTVQYINALIDSEFKGKVNKALLMKKLQNSFKDIVSPSIENINTVLEKVEALQAATPSPQLANTINSLKAALQALENLEKNWNVDNIKKVLTVSGLPYTGQVGILEKAIQEVSETSDISENKEAVEEQEEEEEDLSLREKTFDDAAALTENFKTKTSFRQKRFMSGITKVDNQGQPVKGFLDLPQYMSFNEIYDSIYSLLGSGVYIESDYNTMKAKLLQMSNTHPWIKELIEKYDNADEQLRKGLVLNYRKHAINMKFMMYDNRSKDPKLQVYDTNANEITRVITNTWANNFTTSPLVVLDKGQYSINRDTAIKLYDQYKSWGTEGHLQDDQVIRNWLSNFGIDFSDEYWRELKEVGMMDKGKYIPYNLLFSSPNTPMGYLGIYLDRITNPQNVNYIQNLKFEENPKAHPFKDMSGVLKNISKGESRFTNRTTSTSFRDGQKSITGITNPTYVTNRVDDLIRSAMSEDKKMISDLRNTSIGSGSTMLKLLMEYPDFAKKLELNHLGITALKQYGKKANSFSSITDLNIVDHELTKLGFFQDQQQGEVPATFKEGGFRMRMARMFLPTMSDKSQMLVLNTAVIDFMKESNSAFETDNEGELIFTEDLRELLYQKLVLPELKRISNFHRSVKETSVKDYDKAAQIFNMIPALNNVKDKDGYRIIQHLTQKSVEDVEALFKEDLINVVEDVMHSLAQQKVEAFDSFVEKDAAGNITKVNFLDSAYLASNPANVTIEERLKHAAYDFVLNSVLTNADTFSTIAGDPAFFSQDKNFEKDTPPYAMSSDAAYMKLAKKQGVNIGKRLAYLSAPGTTLADSKDAKYKQVFLKDDKGISQNSKYLISLYEGKERLKESFMGSTVSDMIDKYPTLTPASQAVVRKGLQDLFPSIGDYFDIDTTDAQEYTTVKEHIGILYNQERLSEDDYKRILDKVERGDTLAYEDIKLVMQPIKPVYTGQTLDSEKDMSRPIYIKSSSFPLIKELTAGLQIDNLRVALENLEKPADQGGYGMPVRASYQSANKVGAVIDANTVDPLNPQSLQNIEAAMVELDRNNFRIQQDVPFKSDKKKEDKISMGTQIFKLLFGDGILDIEGFEYKGKTYKGEKLYDEYNATFQALVESKKQQLYTELGLDSTGTPINETETILKVQNLLQKEALERNYPLKDIKGLELKTLYDTQGNPYYEFNIPLWLSTNSNRYESLLNAIVSNRLVKHKIPGNSFVAASENGFGFKENLEGIDQSRIIFMDDYDGKELKGVLHAEADENGVRQFKKAQVFVPSKFKDSQGKLVDLFAKNEKGENIYIEKRENGTWRLKDGVIDPELLAQFSFRTPTSSHVSASTIEIAGILPPESGDLMIVPKNFTKQKGLDFDVDKENVYQLHHITDYKTGKVEVFSEKHKEKTLKEIQKVLDKLELQRIKLQRNLLPEEAAELLGQYGALEGEGRIDLAKFFGEDLLQEVLNDEASQKEKYANIEAKLTQKLLENDFIRIHSAVFNNPNPEVQKKINKVLSMDFAREQADLIEELTEESKVRQLELELTEEGVSAPEAKGLAPRANNNFTILSDDYQKNKMGLGAAGKMAIGIYSNYVTLHSLIQQTRRPIRMVGEYDPVSKKYEPKEINIGGQVSKGVLGLVNTLDGSRSIAEAFAERQNTATDNEKEQILGRVNISSHTIGVDSLLTLLGYDKTSYIDDQNNRKDLSLSYAILSQPIIKEYVEELQKSRGVTAEYNPNAEQEIIEKLFAKYQTGTKFEDISSDILTGNNLIDGIRKSGLNGDVQVAALKLFTELNDYAKNMAKVQSVVGLRQLDKSIFETHLRYEDLENLGKNKSFENISSLIGDFIPVEENLIKPEGYQVIGSFFVKPTTPQGSIVVNSLKAAKTLWADFFPYDDPYLKKVMESVFISSGVPTDSKFKQVEAFQDVFDEVKKYLNSWNKFGIFEGTATSERQRLFIDTNTNMSLANYLNSNSREALIAANKLLNRFTYEVQTDGRPSLIKFNNTISDDLNEKYLYNTFAEMIINDSPLPDFNGQPFSTRLLAQELITYSFIEGGVQEATQFIKYVPLEYLEEVGIKEEGKFVSTASLLQRLNTKRNPELFKHLLGDINTIQGKSLFIKQYFQHNPEKTTVMTPTKLGLTDEEIREADTIALVGKDFYPDFFHVKIKTYSKLKQHKYDLFQHLGSGQYVKVPVLGTTGMNEYQAGYNKVNSVFTKQKEAPKSEVRTEKSGQPTLSGTTGTLISNNVTAASVIESIANSTNKNMERYKFLAKALLPFVSPSLKITTGNSVEVYGAPVAGFYDEQKDYIFMDLAYASGKKGKEIGLFMHELVHALSVRELKKYYTADENGFFTVLDPSAPPHVVALDDIWKQAIASLDPKEVSSMKDKITLLRQKKQVNFTNRDTELNYAGIDIFEFLSLAMESEVFQKHLSEIPYNNGPLTLLQKFAEILKDLIRTISPDIKEDSLAEATLNTVLDFLETERAISEEMPNFEDFDSEISEEERNLLEQFELDREEMESQGFSEDIDLSQDSSEEAEENLLPVAEEEELPCNGGLAI